MQALFAFAAVVLSAAVRPDAFGDFNLSPGLDAFVVTKYVAKKSFTPNLVMLDALSFDAGDLITVTHDPRHSVPFPADVQHAYGINERTGQYGWFALSHSEPASSVLQIAGSRKEKCEDTYFSDWGSSGMKVFHVRTKGRTSEDKAQYLEKPDIVLNAKNSTLVKKVRVHSPTH